MQTITGVAESLGVSVRGVRLRLDALNGTLDAHLGRGQRNEILFDGEALAILRRLEELRHTESISVRQAASRIREELDPNDVKPPRQSATNVASTGEMAALREMIDDLRCERDQWRELAVTLQEQVAALTPLALPRPRRWFTWLRGK